MDKYVYRLGTVLFGLILLGLAILILSRPQKEVPKPSVVPTATPSATLAPQVPNMPIFRPTINGSPQQPQVVPQTQSQPQTTINNSPQGGSGGQGGNSQSTPQNNSDPINSVGQTVQDVVKSLLE